MTLADDAKPTDFKTLSKTKCPLCSSDAESLPVHYQGTWKRFQCRNCNIFVIHNHDLEKIEKLPNSKKEEFAKASNACSNDTVLIIQIDEHTREFMGRCEPEYNWS